MKKQSENIIDMRKFIERIAFYIRYEMTEEVKARIEMGCFAEHCSSLLVCLVMACMAYTGRTSKGLNRNGLPVRKCDTSSS